MSKYYRKNILQAAGVAPDTDTSSSSSSSNLTVESTLSMSTDESRPVIGGGNSQLQLETVGNGGGNGQPPKPRSNNTEVHVYVYKNCLECAETDGKKIIEAVELATFDSFQNGGDGGDNDPSAVLKAPLLGGHPATMAGTVKAKEEKAAQVNSCYTCFKIVKFIRFLSSTSLKWYRLTHGRTNNVPREPWFCV